MSDQQGLAARIRQLGRRADSGGQAEVPAGAPTDRVLALEARVSHLEQLLEGLQDAVHRDSERHDGRIDVLEAKVQPGAIATALAYDARKRGL